MSDSKKKINDAAAQSARKMSDAASSHATMVRDAAGKHARLVASDIFAAIKTDRQAQLLCVIMLLAIVCWEMPIVSSALYPLKLFETIVHEACHAFMSRLTGGQVAAIALDPSRSGVTLTGGGIDFLVSCAGYMGSATFGGLLIWWGRKPSNARLVLHTTGIVVLALTAFYVGGGFFSVLMSALIGASLFFISRKASDKFCHIFLLVLAVITTLEGLLSIEYLIYASAVSQAHSDAQSMQELTKIPAIFWSLSWGLYSLVVLVFSFWMSYKPAAAGLPDAAKTEGPAESSVQDSDEQRSGQIADRGESESVSADVPINTADKQSVEPGEQSL